jgi:hypothetical protein
MIVREELGTCGAFETLSPTGSTGITSTLEKPTSGVYNGKIATAIIVTVEDFPIRFRLDGTAPSSTVGHKLDPGQSMTIVGGVNLINFLCIDTAAGASTVSVSVFY